MKIYLAIIEQTLQALLEFNQITYLSTYQAFD